MTTTIAPRLRGLILLALLGLPVAGQDPQQDKERQEENRKIAAQLPDGDGKTILESRCGTCHGLARVASGKKSLKSWSNTIKVMVMNGAVLEDRELETLTQYLAQNFSVPVNVNSASETELAAVPGIERALAAAIVRYREKHGEFAAIQDLSAVEGMTPEILKRISNRLTVGVRPASPEKKD